MYHPMHAPEQAAAMAMIETAEANAELRKAALDDLVREMFDGHEYPRNCKGRMQINLLDILAEQSSKSLAEAINAGMFAKEWRMETLKDILRPAVVRAIEGTHWHMQRIAELAQERAERAANPIDGMASDEARHAAKYGTGVRPAWD